MSNSKVLSFLGIVKKAGKISYGYDSVKESLKKGNPKLILFASDLSQNSKREIKLLANERNIKVLESDIRMAEFEVYLRKKTGIICINDIGFAKKIIEIFDT